MELILLAVPFITSVLMFGAKRLAGLYMIGNGETPKPWLRLLLIAFSLIGVVSSKTLAGDEIDPMQLQDLVRTFVETGFTAYFSHAFYSSAFRR